MKINNPVKILLVDDLPQNLFALEIILSNKNYICVKANSGNEALKILLHQQDFALILIDVQMPEMNGFETVELIRQEETLKLVPIIFLTASTINSSHIFKGYQTGAVDFMIKPLNPEILKAKVAVFADLYLKNQELLVQKEQLKALYRDVVAQKMLFKYSHSLIEASHDPLFAVNHEGKITDMNNASAKVIGLSRQKLIGTDFFNYFTEPQKAREVYQEVFEKGFVADSYLTIKHKQGKLTEVLFNGSVYKDDTGNVTGVVIVARDVTEQKRFQNELIEAKTNAEEAVRSKQQFLSNMSHEIRTPLNAIIGFTKVVLKTVLNKDQKEYLNAIKVSGDALIVLINDILDLAKVDAGKMTFEQTPFKMAMSIQSILQLFETKIQEKNLMLVTDYDAEIPEVLAGDAIRLNQIILNLVGNAVKFTSEGKITVSAKLIKDEEEKVTIEFAVKDTGIGIPQNKIASIFDNFQQATSSTSRLYGGTGLGLAIVKQLVDAQSGSLHVESIINQGSTFSFTLPFQKTNAETESETIFAKLDSGIKNIKVLVVEDIALNQLLIKTLLDDFGFERDIADNGKIAIEKLKNNAYDIILMDLQMPEMNGFEATEYIRNTMNSNIPIIALTADVTTVDLTKCKAVGMNDYIAKPIDERLLYSKIVGLVKKPAIIDKQKNEMNKISLSENITCTNLDYLKSRTKSNRELLMQMISLYIEQTPPLVIAMKQSFKEEDWKTLQASVHKMIPSFTIMGISSDYEEMAKKVQEYARNQQNTETFISDKEEITALVLEIENICLQACNELEEANNTIKNAN